MLEENISTYLRKHSFEEMRLKAVLFDMDGVLYNSMPYHAKSWYKTAQLYGFDLTEQEAYLYEGQTGNGTIGLLARRCWGREATDAEIKEIYAKKCDFFNTFPPAQPMAGAAELLRKIKRDGFQIVLVTGSGQHTLLDRLARDFPDIFHTDLMVTSFDVKHGKPNPEPYLMGLQKAAVQPWEGIVVENAPLGVRAGTAADIFTIAVNTGPLPDDALLREGANLLLGSMQELCDKWESIRDAVD